MVSKTLAETSAIAAEFIANLAPRRDSATTVGLYGDLGSGKTTFTQAVARALGVGEPVTSPTFIIERIYHLPIGEKWHRLIHLDGYRLETPDELAKLGFQSLITDPSNLILIEWADRVASLLPPSHTKIYFKTIGETRREIIVSLFVL